MEFKGRPSKADTAVYLGALAEEMRTIAQQSEIDTLTYLFGMAVREAKHIQDIEDCSSARERAEELDFQRLYLNADGDD